MHASVHPLAWLDAFCSSLSVALGSPVSHSETPGRHPLEYKTTFRFAEPVSGKSFLLIWNLIQLWAAENACATKGKVEKEGLKMTVTIITKGRFGLAQIRHPLGDKK